MLKNKRFKIETKDGFVDFEGIVKYEKQQLFKVTLEDDTFIEVTFKHVFVVDGKEIMLKELSIGDFLETKTGLKMVCDITPTKIDYVYDFINVDNPTRTYYSNDVLSHNCAFLGSSSTLIDADVLQRLTAIEPIHFRYGSTLRIYKIPEDGAVYILGTDAGKGIGKDSSSIQVLKIISEREVEQVAVYTNNRIDVYNFAQVIIEVSRFYNGADIMIENNGEGSEVANRIWYDYEYDKIVNYDKKTLGINANVKTKLAACLAFKRYAENGWLTIYDKETIQQMTYFEERGENIFKAIGSQHDDLVTSLYWAIYYVTSNQFDKQGDVNNVIDKKNKLVDEEDDGVAGICIIDN